MKVDSYTRDYLSNIIQRLEANGFRIKYDVIYRNQPFKVVAKRGLRAVPTGLEECFFFFNDFQTIDWDTMKKFSNVCLSYTKRYKLIPYLPLSGVLCFPVAMVNNPISNVLDAIYQTAPPFRFGYMEMPVILDIGTKQLHYFQGTPLTDVLFADHCRDIIRKTLGIYETQETVS